MLGVIAKPPFISTFLSQENAAVESLISCSLIKSKLSYLPLPFLIGKNKMKRITSFLLTLACFIPLQQAANAQSVQLISGIAKKWRLQNYVPDNVVLWFTGSPCVNGSLELPANATKADRDRLFATVSLSKATDKPMFVFYTVNSGICTISSFGTIEQ